MKHVPASALSRSGALACPRAHKEECRSKSKRTSKATAVVDACNSTRFIEQHVHDLPWSPLCNTLTRAAALYLVRDGFVTSRQV
jgi:hypothetical protein